MYTRSVETAVMRCLAVSERAFPHPANLKDFLNVSLNEQCFAKAHAPPLGMAGARAKGLVLRGSC